MQIKLTAAAVLGAAALAGGLPTPASAAVTTGVIAALPDTSGMELTYASAPNSTLTATAIRAGVTLSTATAHTDNTGAAAVNGGGGDCWQTVTPDLLPGDTIQVTGTDSNGPFTDTMIVGALTTDRPIQPDPLVNTVVVHGNAANRPPEGQLEARIIGSSADNFDDPRASSSGRVLRAAVGSFPIHYDGPTGGAWTATYSGLTTADVNRALNTPDSRGVIRATLSDLTISQNPVLRGPRAPCAAPFSQTAITSTDHPQINVANVGTNVKLSGVVAAAGPVTVTLNDENPGTLPVNATATVSPGTGTRTWTATFPAASVHVLVDGTITASMSPTGGTLTMLKDTVAPPVPTANPAAGLYESAQSVTLSGQAGSTIHYTNDGSNPTVFSPTASPGIDVTSSQTLKAIAVDAAGNPGAVGTFDYTITPPAAQTGGNSGTGGSTTVINQTIVGPGSVAAPPAVQAITTASSKPTLALKALGLSPRIKLNSAKKRGLRLSMRIPSGTQIIKLNVYRKTNKGLTLLSSGYKVAPSSVGVAHVAQNQPALRRLLKKGDYQVQVTPGYSKSELGTTSKASFKVV
jgi:hypothetical protein